MSHAADLIVLNASLWSGTVRPDRDALAVAGGRIVEVGRSDVLAARRGPGTRVLDAGGNTVTPGLIDAHIHLVEWARSLRELEVGGVATRAGVVERVARHAAEHPGDGPIIGRGWDANAWAEPPHRAALDPVSRDRVVLLHSHDFHALWVNSAALAAAGIGRGTPDPEGGRIVRDASGEPTGVLLEHAVRLCAALGGAPPDAGALRVAVERLHAQGVTAVHDFEGAAAQRLLAAMARGPQPRVRVLMHLPHAALDHALALGLESGTGDDRFRIGALKIFADGTLGSRTAAMLAPFDGAGGLGMELVAPAALREAVRRAVEGGISVAVHAIGDRACRSTLDAFEAVRDRLPALALPPRLEHAQLVDPRDLPRFAQLGVAASMQPLHCTADWELAERAWGARCEHAYPWRSLLASGALLAFGSDAPVEPPSVARGLHAAVTRSRPDRDGAFVPGERIGLDQALAAYTEGAARLSGGWPRIGTLEPGAWADLVIWSADLHRSNPEELRDAYPLTTVIEGEVVYTAEPGGTARPGGGVNMMTAGEGRIR